MKIKIISRWSRHADSSRQSSAETMNPSTVEVGNPFLNQDGWWVAVPNGYYFCGTPRVSEKTVRDNLARMEAK